MFKAGGAETSLWNGETWKRLGFGPRGMATRAVGSPLYVLHVDSTGPGAGPGIRRTVLCPLLAPRSDLKPFGLLMVGGERLDCAAVKPGIAAHAGAAQTERPAPRQLRHGGLPRMYVASGADGHHLLCSVGRLAGGVRVQARERCSSVRRGARMAKDGKNGAGGHRHPGDANRCPTEQARRQRPGYGCFVRTWTSIPFPRGWLGHARLAAGTGLPKWNDERCESWLEPLPSAVHYTTTTVNPYDVDLERWTGGKEIHVRLDATKTQSLPLVSEQTKWHV